MDSADLDTNEINAYVKERYGRVFPELPRGCEYYFEVVDGVPCVGVRSDCGRELTFRPSASERGRGAHACGEGEVRCLR